MQYLSRGGRLSYPRFFEYQRELGFVWFDPVHFEYDRLIAHYIALFGTENVHVLQQEALTADMDTAWAALAHFAGAATYAGLADTARRVRSPSYPEYAVWALRRVNHVQESVLNHAPVLRIGRNPYGLYHAVGYALKQPLAAQLFGNRQPVSAWVRKHFAGHYADSNARLAEISPTPLDLSDYG